MPGEDIVIYHCSCVRTSTGLSCPMFTTPCRNISNISPEESANGVFTCMNLTKALCPCRASNHQTGPHAPDDYGLKTSPGSYKRALIVKPGSHW